MAIAIVAATAPSASATTTTFSEPFAGTLSSVCTGDAFVAQGTAHFKATAGDPSLGGLKYQIEINTTGVTGKTATGVKYVSNDQTSDMLHADDDVQTTFEQTMIMTRQGEAAGLPSALHPGIQGEGDDFRLRLLIHLTEVNGVTKATKFELRADCR